MKPKRPRGRPPHADLLTPAEWRTVYAVQHGMTNVEIARRRGISVNAVKFHVTNALAKLGLPDRKALRGWFRSTGEKPLNSGLQLGPIGQIARSQPFRQALSRPGDVECGPVESVSGGPVGGILDVVKDHRVGF